MHGLDQRQLYLRHAERPACDHRADESQWPEPQRASALQRRQQADRNHHGQMVEAREGMLKAGKEA